MKAVVLSITFWVTLWLPSASHALEYGLIRRLVVFPILVPEEISDVAEQVWWDMREQLTRDRRFLLASKYFLQKKDVYQPRGALSPADAIILGKLLDAHALVVTYLQKNTLSMVVYSGEDGSLFWKKKLNLHQSVRVPRQLSKAVSTLVNDFLATLPYQGFQIVDALIGQAIYEQDGVELAKVEIGLQSQIQVGDPVQWIRLTRVNLEPLFADGGRITVFAEGKVAKVESQHALVEVVRAKNKNEINEADLVRFPAELKRLNEDLAMEEELKRKISPEFISSELESVNAQKNAKKPLASSLAWIMGMMAYLLLAF
ncbi:MAG: hypothetical protein SGJ18_16315 [Pseudomonadota bacterium]|nr:hypothetical protein [Pseudomonadota bacterium]